MIFYQAQSQEERIFGCDSEGFSEEVHAGEAVAEFGVVVDEGDEEGEVGVGALDVGGEAAAPGEFEFGQGVLGAGGAEGVVDALGGDAGGEHGGVDAFAGGGRDEAAGVADQDDPFADVAFVVDGPAGGDH